MTTKAKVSTTKKSARKSVKNAASVAGVSSAAVAAITAAAVAGSASSSDRAKAINAGLASAAAVAGVRSSAVAAVIDEDPKVIELRQEIASNWSAPCFEDSEDYKTLSAALAAVPENLRNMTIEGAKKKWLSLPENQAQNPSVCEVVDYIRSNFSKEFKNVVGCACPPADMVRVYSYSNMSVSTIAEDSDIMDYFYSSPLPAGASASAIVSAVMSIRVLMDIKSRRAAAAAAARSVFKEGMCSAARRARRLGISSAVAARYFSYLLNAVPAADDSEKRKLNSNLSRCWVALRACENRIVLAGGRGALADGCGGWCFPAAGLAAVLPAGASASSAVAAAKVRKLWSKRVRLLSSINTLEMLLSRG